MNTVGKILSLGMSFVFWIFVFVFYFLCFVFCFVFVWGFFVCLFHVPQSFTTPKRILGISLPCGCLLRLTLQITVRVSSEGMNCEGVMFSWIKWELIRGAMSL